MYAITGALGQTGTAVAETLLKAGESVRLIVRRDNADTEAWRARGAQILVADMSDAAALTQAFTGTQGAYLMNPPAYGAPDLFAQANLVHRALISAATQAKVPHVVALSSVGAHQSQGTGNILTTHDFENQLRGFSGQCTILRAANFMENWSWSMAPLRSHHILPSMFQPLARALPMVAAADIGATAAQLLREGRQAPPVVELHGPRDYSPLDAAQVLSTLLGQSITAVETPRADWPAIFQGMGFPTNTVQAFCDMFDGFNQGIVAFEGGHETRRGTTDLPAVLAKSLAAQAVTA